MEDIFDGGPAFPRPASEFTKAGTLPDGNAAIQAQDGMSKREEFAKAALQGCTANYFAFDNPRDIADRSVMLADMLLAALNQDVRKTQTRSIQEAAPRSGAASLYQAEDVALHYWNGRTNEHHPHIQFIDPSMELTINIRDVLEIIDLAREDF